MAKKSAESLLHQDVVDVLTLFKQLSLNLRERYGSHKTNRNAPLASEDNWSMVGKAPATFTSVAIYLYSGCYPMAAIRTAKGALWLEIFLTTTVGGKKIRKGSLTEIKSISHLAEILNWITEESDILCKNGNLWEYADEFHLWTFQT